MYFTCISMCIWYSKHCILSTAFYPCQCISIHFNVQCGQIFQRVSIPCLVFQTCLGVFCSILMYINGISISLSTAFNNYWKSLIDVKRHPIFQSLCISTNFKIFNLEGSLMSSWSKGLGGTSQSRESCIRDSVPWGSEVLLVVEISFIIAVPSWLIPIPKGGGGTGPDNSTM